MNGNTINVKDVLNKVQNFKTKVENIEWLRNHQYKQNILDGLDMYRKYLETINERSKDEQIRVKQNINTEINQMKKRLRLYEEWHKIKDVNINKLLFVSDNNKIKYKVVQRKNKENFTEPSKADLYSGNSMKLVESAIKLLNLIERTAKAQALWDRGARKKAEAEARAKAQAQLEARAKAEAEAQAKAQAQLVAQAEAEKRWEQGKILAKQEGIKSTAFALHYKGNHLKSLFNKTTPSKNKNYVFN